VRAVELPDAPAPFGFVVAGPQEEIESAVQALVWVLAAALVVLGLGLVGAVVGQVGVGLGPLRRLRRAVAAVRAGRAARVDGAYPAEVAPLADEINELLAHDAEVVMRARTQAGDLAHALKTPLAVLANEAAGLPPERAALVRGQADLMRRHIDRHLSRARAAASHSVLGARCAVGPVGAALVRTLTALHRDHAIAIAIAVDGLDGLVFCGDRHDLEEMLGNLMDNACKWGRTQVRVAGRRVARPDGDRLELTVEDDGPGIPEQAVAEVLVRGRRLDESVPGSGLGLAIVDDLAALYRGGVALRRSELGGLAAVLDLPAAA
jgi:signal transduction histidine kinase